MLDLKGRDSPLLNYVQEENEALELAFTSTRFLQNTHHSYLLHHTSLSSLESEFSLL